MIGALLVSNGALAQTPDASAPDAETLFLEGREAMGVYDYETACALFRKSQHEQPATGTLLNLGLCEEKLGHYVAAIANYRAVRDRLDPTDERHGAALERLTYLESRIPHLTIRFETEPPAGTRIRHNGVPLSEAELGKRVAVDPGEHEIVVSSPGRVDSRLTVRAEEEEDRTVFAELGPLPGVSTSIEDPEPSWYRPLGYTLGIVGAASLVTAGITGGIAFDKANTVRTHCPASNYQCADDASYAAASDAAESGPAFTTAAIVTAVVGVVGLGTGAYLLWTSDGSESETPVKVTATAAPLEGGGGVFVVGSF